MRNYTRAYTYVERSKRKRIGRNGAVAYRANSAPRSHFTGASLMHHAALNLQSDPPRFPATAAFSSVDRRTTCPELCYLYVETHPIVHLLNRSLMTRSCRPTTVRHTLRTVARFIFTLVFHCAHDINHRARRRITAHSQTERVITRILSYGRVCVVLDRCRADL